MPYTPRRRNQRGSSIVEFALSLLAVFIVVFSLINLTMIAASVAGAYFIATYSAVQACTQTSYDQALATAMQECTKLAKSGFGSWVKMQPVGGFAASGVNLYVEERDTSASGTSRTIGPNTPVPAPIDTAKKVYEYSTNCTFDVGPFVNLSSFPGLKEIPFVGRAARLNVSASRAVEHPEGLTGYGTLTSLAKTFNGLPPGITLDDNGKIDWNLSENQPVNVNPGSTVSYMLVKDPQGNGAFLMQVSLGRGTLVRVDNADGSRSMYRPYDVNFVGVRLVESTNGMLNQLESFNASDNTGNSTSYVIDPGQEISIKQTVNVATIGEKAELRDVQRAMLNVAFTQGMGFPDAVTSSWQNFQSWYQTLQLQYVSTGNTTAEVWRPTAPTTPISTQGAVSVTPSRTP